MDEVRSVPLFYVLSVCSRAFDVKFQTSLSSVAVYKESPQAVGSPVHAVSGRLADLIVGSRAVQPVYADPLSTGFSNFLTLPVGI